MKTMQGFAVSTMAAAVLLALAGCGGMSTRDSDSGAAPAVAQGPLPQCANSNYDQARGVFTIIDPASNTVHQQCLLTVHPAHMAGAQDPAPFYVEGRYDILVSGGGGAGAAGERWNRGGGGGGGGAPPLRSTQYLSPGVYMLTIGTGGTGGKIGKATDDGNLSNITNADTGVLIAGYAGAEVAKQTSQPAGIAHGGVASPGGSFGGDGGDVGPKNSESAAQAGGESQTPGYAGVAGDAGVERSNARRDDGRGPQANAGGGGGAGVGSGGTGESRDGNTRPAMVGDLGGGGAGGRGGFFTAHPGAQGGHGFIQLARSGPPLQAMAPAVVVVEAAPEVIAAAPERAPAAASADTAPAPVASRPARKDRN